MFWRFNMHAGAAIDGLLDREDCTLTDLLNEDDVLQECKANNRKLIDFLIDQKVMEEMVHLVVTEPEEDPDGKFKYKHSSMACNLLTSDVIQIVDKLASETSLLDQLWSFLDTDKSLNALLAAYFSKVIATLLKAKTEIMLEYIRGKANAIQLFLDHIDTSAIMDLVLVLTSCSEVPEQKAELMLWLEEERLIPRLVDLIDPSVDEARQSNASQTLCEMLRMCRENGLLQPADVNQPDHLLCMLEDPSLVSQLLSNMLKSSDTYYPLILGITYILTLLEPRSQVSEDSPLGFTIFVPEKSVPAATNAGAIVEVIIPFLPKFHQMLESPASMLPVELTIGTLDPPFGNARLQIVRLIVALLVTDVPDVYTQLAQLNTLKVLLDLFFHYDLNNFLHLQVELAVKTVLSSPVALDNNDSDHNTSLFASLFQDCRLLQRIVLAGEEDVLSQNQRGARRKGYMGHLNQIAADILKEGDVQPRIKAAIEELTEEDHQLWTDFVMGPYAEVRRKNDMDLGGKRPLMSSFDESGEEDDFSTPTFNRQGNAQDSSLAQEYTHYQMQQMSSEFVESFGLDDEEFPTSEESTAAKFDRIQYFDFSIPSEEDNSGAALFEACCHERIQPYGELDEDEVWQEKELTYAETPTQERMATGRMANTAHYGNTSSEDEAFCHDEREVNNQSDRSFSTHITITPSKDEPDDDDMEIEFEMMNWPQKSEDDSSRDQQIAIDADIPDWAREPITAQQEAGWADFDNLGDSPFDNDIAMMSSAQQSPSSSKYTAELAEELMGKVDDTDQGNGEVGTDDESDESDDRSGSYCFVTEEEGGEALYNNPENHSPITTSNHSEQDDEADAELVEVNIEMVNDITDDHIDSHNPSTKDSQNADALNDLPDSRPTSTSGTEATPCAISTSEDMGPMVEARQTPDDDNLVQNYTFLSNSGMMKTADSVSSDAQEEKIGDSQGVSGNRDIEQAREKARQAMDLYDTHRVSNETDTN